MPETIASQKAALRAKCRAFRAQMIEADYVSKSAAIAARAGTLPELLAARTVHTYWPMPDRREVDVRPLIGRLQDAGKQIVLPVVVTSGRGAGRPPLLRHVLFEGADTLQPNRWGLYEPEAGKSVPPIDLDAVIVPVLCADRNGNRLGYGGGYYDAFLRGLRVPTIGLVYAACLVASVPAEAHDIPLRVLITEHEIIRPPRA